jgi:transposase
MSLALTEGLKTGTQHRRCLHTLAADIDRDRDAVIAGLTLPWSSGAVEGHVNRIKMIKRQMHGRTGFNLLRKRVLLAS